MPSVLKLYTILPSVFCFSTTMPSGGWLAASNSSCRRRQYDSSNKYRHRGDSFDPPIYRPLPPPPLLQKYPVQLSTNFALDVLKESLKFAQHRLVLRQDELHGSVLSYSKSRYFVNLAEHTCSCGRFQINDIPCGHAVALIYKLRGHPRDFIPRFFSLETYRDTYCFFCFFCLFITRVRPMEIMARLCTVQFLSAVRAVAARC